MVEVRKHLKRANIDQPVLDVAALAKSITSKTKAGIGDTKREEVRFLILSGLPHAEFVKRSGVSSGTVSLIRSEMREVILLYRNSESGLSVPFAYLSAESSDVDNSRALEKIGGAGSQSERRLWRNFPINREKYRENRKVSPQTETGNALIPVFRWVLERILYVR